MVCLGYTVKSNWSLSGDDNQTAYLREQSLGTEGRSKVSHRIGWAKSTTCVGFRLGDAKHLCYQPRRRKWPLGEHCSFEPCYRKKKAFVVAH
jgi:hypothetical protein